MMDTDHIYKRQMGMVYDRERAQAEVASGFSAGRDGHLDRSNGFEDETDLTLIVTDERTARLQEIEAEFASYMSEFNPSDADIEAVLMLEVEKAMLKEEIAIGVVADNPIDTRSLLQELGTMTHHRSEALTDYLVTGLIEKADSGHPVDDEMFAEVTVLSNFIAKANPNETSEGLVIVARAMKEAIDARIELNRMLSLV